MAEVTSLVFPEREGKRRYVNLTQEEKYKILVLRGFKTSRELAEKYGVSVPRIYRIWQQAEPIYSSPIYKMLREWILDLRKQLLGEKPLDEKEKDGYEDIVSEVSSIADDEQAYEQAEEQDQRSLPIVTNSLLSDFLGFYDFWMGLGNVGEMKQMFRERVAIDADTNGRFLDPLLREIEIEQERRLRDKQEYSEYEILLEKVNVVCSLVKIYSVYLPLISFFPALYVAEYNKKQGKKEKQGTEMKREMVYLRRQQKELTDLVMEEGDKVFKKLKNDIST